MSKTVRDRISQIEAAVKRPVYLFLTATVYVFYSLLIRTQGCLAFPVVLRYSREHIYQIRLFSDVVFF